VMWHIQADGPPHPRDPPVQSTIRCDWRKNTGQESAVEPPFFCLLWGRRSRHTPPMHRRQMVWPPASVVSAGPYHGIVGWSPVSWDGVSSQRPSSR